MRDALVIDDKGESWPLDAPRLRAVLMRPHADADVVAYAVRHLGFVLLRRQGRRVRAEMRPGLVKPAALIGLYYTLLDWRPEQIVLSRLGAEGGAHELFDDVAEFAATVERDIADDGVQRHRPDYALSPRSLTHLRRSRYARFMPVVALWHGTRGRLPDGLLRLLGRYGLLGRASLLRNLAGTGRLVYDHIGSSYSFIGNACTPLLLIGRDIEMLPDRRYGDWVACSYYDCLGDQEPRLETVSAVMRRDDGERLWSYYDRVLLPWQGADGARFVLGLSEVRRRTLAA